VKLVVFGLSVSSSWGNGHATLWRGLIGALGQKGHRVTFFERDVSYYARHRDLHTLPGLRLELYQDWAEAEPRARAELETAAAALVTSYCPDGVAASRLVLDARGPLPVFYDLDAPITLERLARGERVEYLPEDGLGGFPLVLSFTGGETLRLLRERLGARRVEPLYGSVDPSVHRPFAGERQFDLSYLGTFAADRQAALDALFFEPAARRPERRFLLAGPLYPPDTRWRDNVFYREHVPPGAHPEFYGSAAMTLNVTRGAMAELGFCPSGRLFEAAACGVPVLSDCWRGLDEFFVPGREILVARSTDDALAALDRPADQLRAVGEAARARALLEHTAQHRAEQLLSLIGR
jgi:spore maturation protein CgeB